MTQRNALPRPITVIEDQPILMPDGCRLSARLWLPTDADTNPVPLILEHLPYRKRDGTIARDELSHPWMAARGYACLRVDMRGNGDSDGLMEDEYTAQEWQDACDVIAWARAQPWCDGNVGMQGISWGGFNCLQVAALRPEGLKAVISICSTVDRYADDIHTKGGCQLGENFGWAAQMLAYSSRPPDPALVGEKWREMWLHRLEHQPFLLETWLAHQTRDTYWQHGSVCEDYSRIEAAVLSIGGWHDGYRNTINHLVSNIKAPVKGIVGPWNHKYPHIAGPEPRIGFLQEAQRWWDRWLKGINTGVEDDPDMRLYLMDGIAPQAWFDHRPGRWVAEGTWPSPRIVAQHWQLGQNRLADKADACCVSVNSPADCGWTGGEFFPFAYGPELPVDQRPDDAVSACFDGPVSDVAQDIVGAPAVSLRLSADKPAAQIAVRLCDVAPDGTSALISHGFLNLQHRNSHAAPKPLVPDEVYEVQVTLDQCAYRLPAGHHLRLAVATNCWPFIWPAPELATVTITGGNLSVPLRPLAEGDEWRFEPPEHSVPWDITTHREAGFQKTRTYDYADGASVIRVVTDSGHVTDNKHGLTQSSITEEEWRVRPDDPLSAKGTIRWFKTMGRGDWQVGSEVVASLWADHTDWHMQAELKVWEGDDTLFIKEFRKSIPRHGV